MFLYIIMVCTILVSCFTSIGLYYYIDQKMMKIKLGLYSHCSSSSQYQELKEKISPLPCNNVKVPLYESSIIYESEYFYVDTKDRGRESG